MNHVGPLIFSLSGFSKFSSLRIMMDFQDDDFVPMNILQRIDYPKNLFSKSKKITPVTNSSSEIKAPAPVEVPPNFVNSPSPRKSDRARVDVADPPRICEQRQKHSLPDMGSVYNFCIPEIIKKTGMPWMEDPSKPPSTVTPQIL